MTRVTQICEKSLSLSVKSQSKAVNPKTVAEALLSVKSNKSEAVELLEIVFYRQSPS